MNTLSLIFLPLCNRTNSSNGKDGWPTLSGHNKLANGLSEDRKSPPLLDYLDQEVITSDGLETELGPGQRTALSPSLLTVTVTGNTDCSSTKTQTHPFSIHPFNILLVDVCLSLSPVCLQSQ